MDVFALIGRIAYAKESTTMAQKRLGEMHQSICRKNPEGAHLPMSFTAQLATIEEVEALLKAAQHNLGIIKTGILEELDG